MQKAVRKYLKALEAGNAAEAGELFTKDGWVQSPFLGRLPSEISSPRSPLHQAIRS